MTKTKIRELILSLIVILLPIIYGVMIYNDLPNQIAIHFSTNNTPDSFVAKPFFIFGIPVLMAILQLVVQLISHRQSMGTSAKKFEFLTMWMIPAITVVMYYITIRFALGQPTDIRRIVVTFMGILFIAMGNYLPTVPSGNRYIHFGTKKMVGPAQKKLQRQMGYIFVIGGLGFLISLFFNELTSVVILALFIVVQLGLMIINYPKFNVK